MYNDEKTEHYTDENPGGPWSKALKAMAEKAKKQKEQERNP
jgi:hypothetical protein